MNKMHVAGAIALMASGAASFAQETQNAQISVNASKVLNRVSPWLAGSCIEDVNHEIYGGLYDQKLYGESFEEPAPSPKLRGWKTWGGSWKSESDGISVLANAGAKQESETPSFTNGSVSTEIKFPSGQGENAGLLVRVSEAGVGADAFNGYEISLEPVTKRVILGKHRHNWQALRSAPVEFNPLEWTRLKVEMEGATLRVYIGDSTNPALEYADQNQPLLSGTFALRTWNSDVAFRSVKLQRPGVAETTLETGPTEKTEAAVSGQWDAVQNGTGTISYALDADRPYSGRLSQKIVRGAGSGSMGVANRGLNQWGISVQAGQRLGGRLYLRASNLRGGVTLALQSLDGQRTYASQKISKVGQQWAKFPISLKPAATDTNARFVILVDGPGTIWIDQATLTGTGKARFKGLPFRADIAEMMQRQGIKFLRYGGTMVNVPGYRWKTMIGDPDKRPPYRGNWYPYSTNAFGIEEFLQFCEAARIEAAFAINIEESAQDAADLVEYLNGAVSTPWGKRRAQNGHPKPYTVKWIEIGNEEVIGSDNATEYDHYIDRFNALSTAMHGKDPNLKLVCSAWWRPESASMERVFKAIQGKAAYWDLHVWSDDAQSGTTVDRDLTQMHALFDKWVPNSDVKCVIFEENGNLHNQQRALGHATTLNAVRRHGDFVVVSCPANALQPDGQNDNGWDQGQIFFNPSQVWGMPPFYAAQMSSANHQPLRVESQAPQYLDVTATKSEDGKTVVVHIVNTSGTAKTTTVTVQGLMGTQTTARKWTLAGEPGAVNAPSKINVQSVEEQMSDVGSQFETSFPAYSYTIIRLNG